MSLSLRPGDAVAVMSDSNEDAHLLLRGLASLESPLKGRVLSHGRALDFSDYRNLLPFKKKVGYVALDAALLSNRTLLENLLVGARYFDHATGNELDEATMELCRSLEVEDKLHLLPSQAYAEDIRLALIVREISKNPDFLLVERPAMDLDHESERQVAGKLAELAAAGLPLVFYSFKEDLIRRVATQKARIIRGRVEVTPFDPEKDRLDLTPGSEAALAAG